MTRTEVGRSGIRPALDTPLVDPLLDSKLRRPPTRRDWIERARLMKELDQAAQRPIILIAAPPGFGKTTMVTQWLASNRGPPVAAWVSLDDRDNDPMRLWTHVALALELAGCGPTDDVAGFMDADGGELIAGVLPQLLQVMGQMEDDLVILLDDFHLLQDPACHRQVEFFIEHLPAQAHLVIITRADPGLRLARLRATGQLAEIRAAELAFTADEASSLLAVEHIELSDASVQDLVQRTEGWAAGIYLATLSISGRSDPDEFIREVSGGSRFIGDYLTEEVLAGHSDEVREFIRVVSILDRFSAPLCDAMTGAQGSAAILHELERTNLFLVPLDERRTWFRFHHLFASVARSELEFEQPDRVPALHRTAARWFRDHGHVDEAITHSLASGSVTEAARLVQANWLEYVDAGRTATVLGWLDALGADSFAADPAARVIASRLAAKARAEVEDIAGTRTALASVAADLAGAPLATQIECWLLEARLAVGSERARVLVDRALREAAREMMRRPVAQEVSWLLPLVDGDPELRRSHGGFLAGFKSPTHGLSSRTSRTGQAGPELIETLTGREAEVLGLLAEMCSTEEIARELFLSVNTVKTYVRGILRKLSVNRRVDAVRRGRELGLC